MTLHDPIVSVHHMLDHAREAVEMVRGRSRADLDADRQLNLSLVRLVEVIGEAANRVPDDFRSRHPQIPWRQTVGMRNREKFAEAHILFQERNEEYDYTKRIFTNQLKRIGKGKKSWRDEGTG